MLCLQKIRDLIGNVYRQEIEIVTLRIELFIELFYYFENSEELEYRSIEEAVYSFEKIIQKFLLMTWLTGELIRKELLQLIL